MKNPIQLAVLAAALTGAASAALTTITLDGPAAAPAPQSVTGLSAGVDMRFDRLLQQNADMAERIALLESQPVSAAALRAPAGSSSILSKASIDQAVEKALAARSVPTVKVDHSQNASWFDQQMTDYDERKDQERDARRAIERDERTENKLVDLTEKLGLDQTQVMAMRTYMADVDVKRNELREQMRGSDLGREGLREAYETYKVDSENRLQQILTPDQYTTYKESNSDRGSRGWGGNNGGRRGGV